MPQLPPLELVYSISIPSSIALNFNVNFVNDENVYRQGYVIMVSVLPGIQDENSASGRTYDKNSRINFKFNLHEFSSLISALRGHAENKIKGNSTKFSKTETENKWFTVSSTTYKSGENEKPGVGISIGLQSKSGKSQKISAFLPTDQALGLAYLLEKILDKIIEIDFERFRNLKNKPTPNYDVNPEEVQYLTTAEDVPF